MRKRLAPAAYVRCTGCDRLVERVNAKRGPEGGIYGPECIIRAIQASLEPPICTEEETEEDG